ncbi:MAG: bifunctional riboflavin kinase/FAD synthetase [Chloroflexi bacterium]|nr:bifunctional riboflavin kinase/FAD synthetase [Chloroflexota bacterium]
MSFRQRMSRFAPDRDTVLTIGVFDGVHQGHCHLLRRLVQLAGSSYIPTVLTFNNHPITVLRPGTQVGYITSPKEKVRLLREQGIELVVSLDFDHSLSQVSADEFTNVLVEPLRMKGLVIGPDSAVGRNREGDVDFLRKKGSELGFWVETIDSWTVDGGAVKSRRIRTALEQGDVTACARLLGRKFSLGGEVVVGAKRGKEMGFPTANLDVPAEMVVPGDGIYATWAIIDGQRYPSATSIGVRPTFKLTERLVEVYVIDMEADLYGKRVDVEFVSKLRDQETFSGVDELVQQIGQDVANTRLELARDRDRDREVDAV